MPDDARTQQIEKRIDRDIANSLTVSKTGGGVFTLAPQNMGEILEFAKMMAISSFCVRSAFRNNPGACLGVAMQAFRVGGDPFAWANKAYITKNKAGEEQLSYEAQIVHATVNASPLLARRLRHFYEGTGTARKCRIVGWLRGEDEPLEYESPPISQIAVKNSPLWQGDPDQQLAYYSTRAWARRHVPEILLGIYTVDEIQGEIIDMTPQHGAVQEAEAAAEPIPWEVCDAEGEVYKFERSNSAIEACRKILIASAADPAKLATAWENNAGFLLSLGQEGLQPEADGIERLYAELMPQSQPEVPVETPPVGDVSAAAAARVVPGVKNNYGPVSETPAGMEQQEVDHYIETHEDGEAPPFAPPATVPEPTAASSATTAGVTVSSQAGPGPTATLTASPSDASGRDTGGAQLHPPLGGRSVVSDQPVEANAAPRQSQPSTDPFWKRPSLKIDPMPVRGAGSLSKLDWKTWPALIGPRIRQVATIELLNRLYQDNRELLDVFESACGTRERNELDSMFDDARMRLA